ncbi:tRNA 2-selenouridine synthase [Roseivivax halotolerans]|jgi:tRNA 2-selenouridine synthase|uniref:tRNA 2-selenouridine synthase n=1 Tax=Roseivivax halotolerans TaxID=93684 RepID=A0A1I6A2X3_9RHOB|nr:MULTISPECIES: tRNA 2-selenouridine(34) synthase MnmH [Roseivivax]QFT62724.1 tRNA 2-selenouridine synthase [Roseivivax sp. THAF30]SFQ63074.1 tRNA 2-selenouridine synthase [Roseivivax halotolerans]
MALFPDTLRALLDHGFDTVIDVRSPAEFAEDHVPGAINLPVLDNEERARVGTIYKQESPFRARKIGAALVFKNAARHIEGPLAAHDGGWRPLVYCWRGGQRSGSMAWMLKEIGWRSDVIQGGYRTYRRLVSGLLYDAPLGLRVIQLGGYTGTAKTDLLTHLAAKGVQVLDLEGLAHHRGSLLGDRPGGQPSQKAFESALARAVIGFDPARPVVVEAESSKIGEINLPPSLWAAMKDAPWIEVSAPIAARTSYLVEAYADILADPETLREKLAPLRRFRGHELVDDWFTKIEAGDKAGLVESLMTAHYDPAYDKSMKAMSPRIVARIDLNGLGQSALDDAAGRIAAKVEALGSS